jgi:hypothetical protein
MKCVKRRDSSKITRVSDAKAKELVTSGTHTYASKDSWKKDGRQKGEN